MHNNNGLFAEGAYQWALQESQKYKKNPACVIDFSSMFDEIKQRINHDVRMSIFESEMNKNAPPIWMIEWIGRKVKKLSFYPIDRESYEEDKKDETKAILIEMMKMSGRIRYQEEINNGKAFPPTFLVYEAPSEKG